VRQRLILSEGQRIMHCTNCRNAFTHPRPIVPDYASEDFQVGEGDRAKLTQLSDMPEEIQYSYHLQLQMLKKSIPENSWILEIGGGEGIFSELLVQNGFSVELVEPSISAAERASTRGLTVHNDYLGHVAFSRKFHAVCMSHVLEHMENPLEAIGKVKALLHPQGCILLAQTNFEGFMPWLLKENWYAWVAHQHFTHFSLAGLKYLAAESNLSIASYRYSRLVHGKSLYHAAMKYIPFLQDQIHILFRLK
jgi:2-polyprenyl-3-methyl-5-hydroxy-6-metoxy-1,4-benzoquinol methylase